MVFKDRGLFLSHPSSILTACCGPHSSRQPSSSFDLKRAQGNGIHWQEESRKQALRLHWPWPPRHPVRWHSADGVLAVTFSRFLSVGEGMVTWGTCSLSTFLLLWARCASLFMVNRVVFTLFLFEKRKQRLCDSPAPHISASVQLCVTSRSGKEGTLLREWSCTAHLQTPTPVHPT